MLLLFCLGQVFLIILPNLCYLDWFQFNLWKVMKFNLRTQTVKNDFRSKNATKNLFSFSLKMLFFNIDTVSLKLIFVQQKKSVKFLHQNWKKFLVFFFNAIIWRNFNFCLYTNPLSSEASRGVFWNQAQKNYAYLYTEYPWVSVTV